MIEFHCPKCNNYALDSGAIGLKDGKVLICDFCKSVFNVSIVAVEQTRALDLPSAAVNHCVPVNGIHAPFCTGHESASQ